VADIRARAASPGVFPPRVRNRRPRTRQWLRRQTAELVVVDRDGKFLEVRLVGHAEPIFMSSAGTATLNSFARQCEG
jgi:hypothetical protein